MFLAASWMFPVSSPRMGSLESASQLVLCFSLAATIELVQCCAQCLACYLCAAAQDGLEHPELPSTLGKAVWL